MKRTFLVAFCLFLIWPFASCDKDNNSLPPIPTVPIARLVENEIIISDIVGIPANVSFDKVKVEISGKCWDIIEVVEAAYKEGQITLTLPTEFAAEKLSQVVRVDPASADYNCGFWPGTSDDPDALVAGLGDIIAYNGDQRVGMITLSDWSGEGSVAGKFFVNYHYADRPFHLSGYNASYRYNASFQKGWNAYANMSAVEEGIILCTTTIPEETPLTWYFKSSVY